MRLLFTTLFLSIGFGLFAQLSAPSQNTADRLLGGKNNLNIAGYADIDWNQPLGGNQFNNGQLDVHRLVLLFGYKFDQKTSFVTEIEFEHVKEVFIEQAFVNHRVNKYLNFRAGLLLIPMGIVNEYHESPTFNGVERPMMVQRDLRVVMVCEVVVKKEQNLFLVPLIFLLSWTFTEFQV